MPQSRCHVGLPEHGNILPGVVHVIVKTPDIQSIFEVANDTSVKQFKERLSAHFNCQLEQLELVFMGRLLKDHDTLSQRGIRDGHTIYVVIKSKHGSRSLAHPFRNLLTNSPCHQDRSTKGNSSRVFPSAGMSQTKVESPLLMKSDAPNVGTQNPDVESPEHIAQMLENLCVQTLLSNMGQLNSEYPDIQELIQHNPGASLLLDNSEILCQTLELARRLAIIREIMQIRRPAQNFEHPLNPQPYVGLEMIPNEAYGLGQSYDNFNDQMFSGMHDLLEDNSVTTLLAGQVVEQVQTPLLSPSPSEEQWDQFPTAHVIYADSCGLPSTNPTQAAPNNVSHASGGTPVTAATTGQSHVCTVQQPAGIPALSSIAVTKELQEDGKGTTTSLGSSDQGVEDLQQSDEQTIAQITGGMIQLLRNHPFTAAQMLLLMNLPQLNEQWRQQPPASLQPLQLSELLSALANPKASQAILQIEHGLQLLATEAPVLLPCIESYLWSLGWFPPSSCSYPDPMPWAWNVPDTAEPQWPECCHKPGTVLQRLQPLSGDSSQSQQAPEVHFRKQMECLQAMGFVNYTANLQALIATDGDMNAAIQKLKRPQGL